MKSFSKFGAVFLSCLDKEKYMVDNICDYFYGNNNTLSPEDAIRQFRKSHTFELKKKDEKGDNCQNSTRNSDNENENGEFPKGFFLYCMACIRSYHLYTRLGLIYQEEEMDEKYNEFMVNDKYSQLKHLPSHLRMVFILDYFRTSEGHQNQKYCDDSKTKKFVGINKNNCYSDMDAENPMKRKRGETKYKIICPSHKRLKRSYKHDKEWNKFYVDTKKNTDLFNKTLKKLRKQLNMIYLKDHTLEEISKKMYFKRITSNLFVDVHSAIQSKYKGDIFKVKDLMNKTIEEKKELWVLIDEEIIEMKLNHTSKKTKKLKENVSHLNDFLKSYGQFDEKTFEKSKKKRINMLETSLGTTLSEFDDLFKTMKPKEFKIEQQQQQQPTVASVCYQRIKDETFKNIDTKMKELKEEYTNEGMTISNTIEILKKRRKNVENTLDENDHFYGGICQHCKNSNSNCSRFDILYCSNCTKEICVECISNDGNGHVLCSCGYQLFETGSKENNVFYSDLGVQC